jgi:hypothetical protein
LLEEAATELERLTNILDEYDIRPDCWSMPL